MIRLISKIRALIALGIPNLCRVAFYRLGIKLQCHPVLFLKAEPIEGEFFSQSTNSPSGLMPVLNTWRTSGLLFGWYQFPVSPTPPKWFLNSFTGYTIKNVQRPWWKISDFDSSVGDIKSIWEWSRMDWVVAFSQRVRNGDNAELSRLNHWLMDWHRCNPPFQGPNWKCGQEASIRVIHLVIAALFMDQVDDMTEAFKNLLVNHLRRIAPTIGYAMSQDNNHATSEAAALYIGGSCLAKVGVVEAGTWSQIGRKALERCASRLIDKDGGFSQYSVNYHRLMLDTLCVVEVWRRRFNLSDFSQAYRAKALAATRWLFHLVDCESGEVPNLGANDGAWLLQFADNGYRDFRPTVQLACALFAEKRAYSSDGSWNNGLKWFGIPIPSDGFVVSDCYLAHDNGVAVLKHGNNRVLLRFPRFKFRPSQCDALHIDMWVGKKNLLRDGGSYSYNTDAELLKYFGGTASHNTIQFDDREQMPKASRFLFTDWLQTNWMKSITANSDQCEVAAGYTDRFGVTHRRSASLSDGMLEVIDQANGFQKKAILRWRLNSADWKLNVVGNLVELKSNGSQSIEMTVNCDQKIVRCELKQGLESLYYMQKTNVPVLEVEVDSPCVLKTRLRWNHD